MRTIEFSCMGLELVCASADIRYESKQANLKLSSFYVDSLIYLVCYSVASR